ncbi:MAG: hypothetical protein ACD_60C00149G0018 [uncultured bacterium]|nr:MAG: hypothetical protein ACD_60C00149G0018 [uncultured bacterium]
MNVIRAVIMLFFLMLSGFSFSSNVSFLNYSSIFYFQGNDKNLMMSNLMNALSNYADGKKASWKNPKTGAWGYAIPSNTRTQNGLRCRNVKVFNEANNVTGASNYTFCKYGNNWKIP